MTTTIVISIGGRIRELRLAAGLDQVALAEKIGTSQNAVSAWERNRHKPGADFLVALADLFDVSVDALLGRDSAWNINKGESRRAA